MQTGEILASNTRVIMIANVFTMNLLIAQYTNPLTNILLFYLQYIFGEFSPDEFNQFFVTPRCSVEVRSTLKILFRNNILKLHIL